MTTRVSHGLASFVKDGMCVEFSPSQHLWHARLGAEPVTLGYAGQYATNGDSEAGTGARYFISFHCNIRDPQFP